MKRVLSGMQPSGPPTLAHLIGTVDSWRQLQSQYHSIFFVADLHAITVTQDPITLNKRIYDLLAFFLASGIDPKKSIIIVQSQLPQHCELAWILSCVTATGELSRMTQYKDKSESNQHPYFGLYAYPVLMAADILLYQTDLVPVGADQKQHLELARLLAKRINHQFGEVLTVPEPIIPKIGSRIMSLQDPTRKMSKSDANPNNIISLDDSPEQIVKKIKKAVTDSVGQVAYDKERPGITNLIEIFAQVSGKTIEQIESHYLGQGYGQFKSDLAEATVEYLRPIQTEMAQYLKDASALDAVIQGMRGQAAEIADKTLRKLKSNIGLY